MGLGGIGIWQLLIVLVIIMLVFGTKKLKNLGSDLGGAIKGFKSAMGDSKSDKEPEQLEDETGSTIEVKAEKVEEKK
jgi:sec-independent protein translocase protein TatA